uniref:Lymphoid-restricted membrane protein n=1 Tax=Scleropages formosus TaxID=113540 RepID=A0A8C9VKK9_SCLFO
MDVGGGQRRHNPVDSICRKLQTIQRRDLEPNSLFQIPKFQSHSYDSPQSGLRRNLEAILKKRTVRSESESDGSPVTRSPCTPRTPDMLTPTGSPWDRRHSRTVTPSNATYTISSTQLDCQGLGPGEGRTWSRSCSTPAAQNRDGYFSFSSCCATYTKQGSRPVHRDPQESPSSSMFSYNLNFCSTENSNMLDCGLGCPAVVVKRLSLSDGEYPLFSSEGRKEAMTEVSLICEEDLLDTIFHACDTQRRGKVYVSRIVDYLRHTTSRSSEDSGLEELCNMLDPEHKDISIDLDTYHAVMREWIDDCRNQGDSTQEDVTQESVKLKDNLSARRSALMNMTSGSLEAFGGEASRGDLETSDLVYCVADLQFNNHKLQEEVRKLKQAAEAMEETNHKLLEEIEDLRMQAKMYFVLLHITTLFCLFELAQRRLSIIHSLPCVSYSAGLSLSVAYRLNQTNSGSLQAELALAQEIPEVSALFTATLDREVLLLLQGPTPEQMSLEFKNLISKLNQDFKEDGSTVLTDMIRLMCTLQALQADLEQKRRGWMHSLQRLDQYTDSLEKELIKMASNMRRSRTEILHLSVRVQEQENQKQQLREELEQLRGPHHEGTDASSQTEEILHQECADSSSQTEEIPHQECADSSSQTEEIPHQECADSSSQTEEIPHQECADSSSQTEEIPHQECTDSSSQTEEDLLLLQSQVGGGHGVVCLLPHQTEFHRLSLGFKCDMFTLEKRLRLEERSRDLAEDNMKREVSSCQGLLQALAPLCRDDNQCMEIIQRLGKNLDILIQSMSRVSSRSEMLGAIHQESRVSKAVEVMIQHVENLRRMYTKEHAELMELRETLMQNERSFGSHVERGNNLQSRSMVVCCHHGYRKVAGKNSLRPTLKRVVSSCAWAETDEPTLMKGTDQTPSPPKDVRPPVVKSGWGLWVSVVMVVVLAGLLALLASLTLQPAVDAAPVGPGDSWVTIQQLLWPYTGLRHNGQPPV